MNRAVRLAALIGLAAYAVPPWYYVEDLSLFSLDWAKGYPFGKAGSALALGLTGSWWLLPLGGALLGIAALALLDRDGERGASSFVHCGFGGFTYLLLQGFAIGLHGWSAEWLAALFGAPGPQQQGMGFGALFAATAFVLIGCRGLAGRGWCRGDAFIVSSVAVVAVLIALFVFFPVAKILVSAFTDN